MAKIKRGQKLLCVPCGRKVVISSAGISRSTIWCCGKPMSKKVKAKKAKSKKKSKRR